MRGTLSGSLILNCPDCGAEIRTPFAVTRTPDTHRVGILDLRAAIRLDTIWAHTWAHEEGPASGMDAPV